MFKWIIKYLKSIFDRPKRLNSKPIILDENTESGIEFSERITDENMPAEESKSKKEQYIPPKMSINKIVNISQDGFLDTESEDSIEKFKNNLQVLCDRAKVLGKIDKFVSIREDDFFPFGFQWHALSKFTGLEYEKTELSMALRKAIVCKKMGIRPYSEIDEMIIPSGKKDIINEKMAKIESSNKTFAAFMLPSVFRSTKHYTINTALELTANYNMVSFNRDFIIIDNIKNFVDSKYGYSMAYRDAYLDVSHEGLPISEEAVILIDEKKYDRIVSDPKVKEELSKRKVIKYRGKTELAINMVLTEMGILPSKVHFNYAEYDGQIFDILDNSIKKLCNDNKLAFSQGHGGIKGFSDGHFTSYFDDMHPNDQMIAYEEAIEFLKSKFPDQKDLFDEYLKKEKIKKLDEAQTYAEEIVERIGIDELLNAINEYNTEAIERFNLNRAKYYEERKAIDSEKHDQFINTVKLVDDFYKRIPYSSSYNHKKEIEKLVLRFFHSESIEEQYNAGVELEKLISRYYAEEEEEKQNLAPKATSSSLNELDEEEK